MPLHTLIHHRDESQRPKLIFQARGNMIHGGGTFKGCDQEEVCWECRDLLRGFKSGEELPNYIMVHDFRDHTKGHECFNTLT